MKYAADNALGILKNSVCYVIVWCHVAPRQRMIRAKMHFRTRGPRHSQYNRYRMTLLNAESDQKPATLQLLLGLQKVERDLGIGYNARRDMRFF